MVRAHLGRVCNRGKDPKRPPFYCLSLSLAESRILYFSHFSHRGPGAYIKPATFRVLYQVPAPVIRKYIYIVSNTPDPIKYTVINTLILLQCTVYSNPYPVIPVYYGTLPVPYRTQKYRVLVHNSKNLPSRAALEQFRFLIFRFFFIFFDLASLYRYISSNWGMFQLSSDGDCA